MTHQDFTLNNISRRDIARFFSDIEVAVNRVAFSEDLLKILGRALQNPKAPIIGLSGTPGAGKSTLLNHVCASMVSGGQKICVLAVDPTSQITGGAILGDRVRFDSLSDHEALFFRSLSGGHYLGGLSHSTFLMALYASSLFDIVFVETIGVGQAEIDIKNIADFTIYCVQPAAGDVMQFIKAGIMEVPDMFVVTKSDMGHVAQKTVSDLKSALSFGSHDDAERKILSVSSVKNQGVEEFIKICLQIKPVHRLKATEFWAIKFLVDLYGRVQKNRMTQILHSKNVTSHNFMNVFSDILQKLKDVQKGNIL